MNGLAWQPVMDGAEMAVLHGDRALAREAVMSGPFSLSINNQRSELAPGSSVVIPATVHHCTWYGAGTVVQVSGMGPFESIYVDLDTLEA